MSDSQVMSFKFTPNWKASLLALMLLPILSSLGFWQLDRAEEKRQLQLLFAERQANEAITIDKATDQQDLRYQSVRLKGEYLNDKTLLLDNRIYKGRFGYEIISPFKISGRELIVLVSRGWLEGDSSRRQLPAVEPIQGLQAIVAEVYVPHGEVMQLAPDNTQGWPRVIQRLKISDIEQEFEISLFRYSVRLKAGSKGLLTPNWVVVNLQPSKHTGYAVQWFAMSFTLLIIILLANTNLWSLLRHKKRG